MKIMEKYRNSKIFLKLGFPGPVPLLEADGLVEKLVQLRLHFRTENVQTVVGQEVLQGQRVGELEEVHLERSRG